MISLLLRINIAAMFNSFALSKALVKPIALKAVAKASAYDAEDSWIIVTELIWLLIDLSVFGFIAVSYTHLRAHET